METTLIIMRIVTSIAYTVLIGLAISTYFYLSRQQQDMKDIKRVLARIFAITMSEHLRSNFGHLNEMKKTLQKLVENEQYEDAKRMQTLITKQEQQAIKALHSFQKEFGDDMVKMEIVKLGKPANEEEDRAMTREQQIAHWAPIVNTVFRAEYNIKAEWRPRMQEAQNLDEPLKEALADEYVRAVAAEIIDHCGMAFESDDSENEIEPYNEF